MTEQVRYRIDRDLVKEAERVCKELGVTPSQVVSMLFAQLVRLRALPFRPSEFPALEEYGATLAQAESTLKEASGYLDREAEAGRLVEFKGKLP